MKFIYECSMCRSMDDIDDYEITGMCPNCYDHHGGVTYAYKGTIEDFLNELINMSESQLASKAMIIQIAAQSLLEDM